jgi:hypothetical protein
MSTTMNDRPLAELLRDLSDQTTTLVRKEIKAGVLIGHALANR